MQNWNGNMVSHTLTAQMLAVKMSTLILILNTHHHIYSTVFGKELLTKIVCKTLKGTTRMFSNHRVDHVWVRGFMLDSRSQYVLPKMDSHSIICAYWDFFSLITYCTCVLFFSPQFRFTCTCIHYIRLPFSMCIDVGSIHDFLCAWTLKIGYQHLMFASFDLCLCSMGYMVLPIWGSPQSPGRSVRSISCMCKNLYPELTYCYVACC